MSDASNPLRNPADPLRQTTPPNGQELFKRMGQVCTGFPQDAVLTAAANLLINSLRQQHSTRRGAEHAWDELAAKSKSMLLNDHYDLTGKRRNVFPFTQHIDVPYAGKLNGKA